MVEVQEQSKPSIVDYNQAYESLVKADDDVHGLLAYALYKQHKRDWIMSYKKDHGGPPGEADLAAFMRSQLLPKAIDGHLRTARSILENFTGEVVETAKPKHEKEAITRRIEVALGYWRSVWAGMGAAFFYTLFLIGLTAVLKFGGIDLLGILASVSSASP